MAPKKQAVSFNEIIHSDRKKKQNERLASEILGKSRRASAPGSGSGIKAQKTKPGSLASRIGVAKRSASANFRPTQRNAAPATVTSTQSRPNPKNKRRPQSDRLLAALGKSNGQATVREPGGGLSIKGASGPFIVVGSNFAPGTTAADIQAAVEPVSGPMLSCRVVSHHPSVTAEFALSEKWSAENVVANFNKQRADGRLLSMTLQPLGTNSHVKRDALSSQKSFDELREQKDRDRRLRQGNATVHDGTYGFGDQNQPLQARSSGLYSDQMMVDAPSSQRAQGRARRQR